MANVRSSATVILMRNKSESNAFQIYVMKRPQTMRAFKGFTVFPGGMLDPEDQYPEWIDYMHNTLNTYELLPIRPDYPSRIASEHQISPIMELPYVIAAIREVFEETGILLCQEEVKSPVLQAYRQALLNKEIKFLDMVKKLDLRFDARKLFYIGRRVTPPPTSVFFDTNFYLAIVPENTISAPSADEVESDHWIEPFAALKQVEQKEMICAPVTIECFYALARFEKQTENPWVVQD